MSTIYYKPKVDFIYNTLQLKDKSEVDKIIVKKQCCRLLNTSHDFFPSFDASISHELVNESL